MTFQLGQRVTLHTELDMGRGCDILSIGTTGTVVDLDLDQDHDVAIALDVTIEAPNGPTRLWRCSRLEIAMRDFGCDDFTQFNWR